MPKIDPTWKQYEKKMKEAVTPQESVQATESFEAERDFQTKKSETVKKWEEDRKKDLMSQKPDWKKRQLKDIQQKQDAPFKRILELGNLYGNVRPAPGYIIVIPDELLRTTESGIVLPDRDNERQNQGTVVATGGAVPIPDSKHRFFEPPVKAGERILFKRLAGADININNKACKLMLFTDVLAIFEEEGEHGNNN